MSYLDKLAKVEALLQSASSVGERQAAQLAKERILSKITDLQANQPIEYKITLNSVWQKRLFITLCAKYGYNRTYRYPRQRQTTVRVRMPKSILEKILWPEFLRYTKIMEELVEEILRDLTDKIYNGEKEELEVVGEIEHEPAL